MSSIPHLYKDTLEKIYKDVVSNSFSISEFNSYLEMMDNLQASVAACVRDAIILFFEKLDFDYCNSLERKNKYYYSGTYQRTLVTIFGEIQFNRKYYYPKSGCFEDGFYYVDQLFSLPKYDCYDMIVKAMLMEEKAKSTYSLAAEIISKKISEYSGQTIYISRQLCHQVFKEFEIDNELLDVDTELLNEENVYILLDEKYIHTTDYRPGNDDKLADKMVKHAILYTGKEKEYKNRYKLKKRVSFSSCNDTIDLVNQIQSYIDSHFKIDTIKNLIIAGDGASWITSFYRDISLSHPVAKLFVLDQFHVGQAICRITKDKDNRDMLTACIINDKKADFIDLCSSLIENNLEHREKIETNKCYITDRWNYIQNAKNPLFIGCPMESHISHDLAKPFARDPKAYSVSNIQKHVMLRDLQLNGNNIKNIYLYSNNYLKIDDSFGYPERIIEPNFSPLNKANNKKAIEIAYGLHDINYI